MTLKTRAENMECAIIASEDGAKALGDEWRELHERAGQSLFTDYDWFAIWWDTLGNIPGRHLHIITGRVNGRLVALLPLAVTRRKGFRILQPIGAEAFFGCDLLCESQEQAMRLWQVARRSPYYDFAHLRDVRPHSECEAALSNFARLHDRDNAYYLSIDWPTSDAWLAANTIPRRKTLKLHMNQLQKKGEVRFEICRSLPVPDHVVDGMVEHKTAWCRKYGKEGMFDQPNVREYYRRLIEHTARKGQLALAWLSCGEEIVAWHLMFQHRHKLCSLVPATNEAWLSFSPGHLLNIRGISWAIDQGFKEFDHLHGDFAYKKMFANNARECREYFFPRTPKGWLGQTLFIKKRALRRRREGMP